MCTALQDVLAMANLEVDMKNIQEGQTVTVKWRGKPVFIRHRCGEGTAACACMHGCTLAAGC